MLKNLSCPAYTAQTNDSVLNCNCASSALAITLYSSVGYLGNTITIKKADTSTNTITITPAANETIDGASSASITIQNEYITIRSVNGGWSIIDSNIGTPTLKTKVTAEGGIAVKLTNKTGGATVKGEVVAVYTASAINNAVKKIEKDVPDPIGVFYESGVADGSESWVVISGIADVYFTGNTTRGHLARGYLTADGAGYVAGQALSEAVPSSPFASDKHFYEIGHVLESRTGAGLAKCVIHFN